MMRYIRLSFIIFTVAFSATQAMSQVRPFTDAANQAQNNPQARLLRELRLSTEQIQQIRKINQETRPLKQKAGLELQKAMRELDQSIYAEAVDENELNIKIGAVVAAQAGVTKINAIHELKVRQVLTAEQLNRFREIRRNFAKRRQMQMQERPRNTDRRIRKGNRNESDANRPPER